MLLKVKDITMCKWHTSWILCILDSIAGSQLSHNHILNNMMLCHQTFTEICLLFFTFLPLLAEMITFKILTRWKYTLVYLGQV